jgi:hypothetical protein
MNCICGSPRYYPLVVSLFGSSSAVLWSLAFVAWYRTLFVTLLVFSSRVIPRRHPLVAFVVGSFSSNQEIPQRSAVLDVKTNAHA